MEESTNSLPLACKQLGKRSFDCTGTVESVWIRIWNPEEYRAVIENCGSQFTEKDQDIMSLSVSYTDS